MKTEPRPKMVERSSAVAAVVAEEFIISRCAKTALPVFIAVGCGWLDDDDDDAAGGVMSERKS